MLFLMVGNFLLGSSVTVLMEKLLSSFPGRTGHLLSAVVLGIRCGVDSCCAYSVVRRFAVATPEELAVNNDDCAICWDSMQAARKLPCGHLFHK